MCTVNFFYTSKRNLINRSDFLILTDARQYVTIIFYRLLFLAIGLPIWQSLNFGAAIGTNFKDMPIAVKNDEVDFLNCHNNSYSYVDGCIFDEFSNQKVSCAVLNYLSSRKYKLVSIGI